MTVKGVVAQLEKLEQHGRNVEIILEKEFQINNEVSRETQFVFKMIVYVKEAGDQV